MASVKGVNYTKQENPVSANILDSGVWGGKVRVQYDEYTANALANGSDISVAKLPKGAIFLQAIIIHEDLGTSVTLQMGDSGDDDRYLAASAADTAGVLEARAKTGVGHKMTADTTIFLKTGGADTTGADKKIQVITFYVVE